MTGGRRGGVAAPNCTGSLLGPMWVEGPRPAGQDPMELALDPATISSTGKQESLAELPAAALPGRRFGLLGESWVGKKITPLLRAGASASGQE